MLQPYEIIGLCGVCFGIFAYGRVQWQRDYAKSFGYSLFNLMNGVLLEISLYHDWNLASAISNGLWILFSLYGLYRCTNYAWRNGKYPFRKQVLCSGRQEPVSVPANEG